MADLLDQWGVFRARLFRESCVFHRGNYVKDLSRLGRELRNVIIVDNSPASYIFHPENAVRLGTLTSVSQFLDNVVVDSTSDLLTELQKTLQIKHITHKSVDNNVLTMTYLKRLNKKL